MKIEYGTTMEILNALALVRAELEGIETIAMSHLKGKSFPGVEIEVAMRAGSWNAATHRALRAVVAELKLEGIIP